MTCSVTKHHDDQPCWAWTCQDKRCKRTGHGHHETPEAREAAIKGHQHGHDLEPGHLTLPTISMTHCLPSECRHCIEQRKAKEQQNGGKPDG